MNFSKTYEILHSNTSIFFAPQKLQAEQKNDCVRSAKLELISGILNTRVKAGISISGRDFDYLYDLEIDELFCEQIKTEDYIHELKNN